MSPEGGLPCLRSISPCLCLSDLESLLRLFLLGLDNFILSSVKVNNSIVFLYSSVSDHLILELTPYYTVTGFKLEEEKTDSLDCFTTTVLFLCVILERIH